MFLFFPPSYVFKVLPTFFYMTSTVHIFLHVPLCSWFVVATVQMTGVTWEHATWRVSVALTTNVVVRTRVFVVVASTVGCDVCTLDVLARVSRQRRWLIQVTLVIYSVPVDTRHRCHRNELTTPIGGVLPRNAMHTADYAVARCLSVCHTPVMCRMAEHVIKPFNRQLATPFQFVHTKRYGNSMGPT